MNRSLASSMLLLAAAALGCSSDGSGAPRPIDALPRELSVAEREVLSASNAFAFDLLRETTARADGPNTFMSPLSVSMALGMTMNGARSTTFDGMRAALALEGLSLAEINVAYHDLIELLRTLDPSVDLRIANAIYFADGVPFEDAFFTDASEWFDAAVAALDFEDPASVDIINAWVEASTAGRIPKIIDAIEPNEVMFLLNALYFKGSWTERFDRARTHDAPFHLATGGTVPVPMMSREDVIPLAVDPELTAVDLQYGGSAWSMTLILPHEEVDVDGLIASFTPERWNALVASFEPTEIMLGMPRFRIDWKARLDEPLKALGMAEAFDDAAADFRGLSQAIYDQGGTLFISRVDHKTFLDVNEEGTEAAAVTSVGIALTSAPPLVAFDRPFLIAIRERLSGTILFLGKIGDPTSES